MVPLSVGNGLYAGSAYLISLAIGLVGQWVWLRKGFLSWLPWAASFALYPAFLSYGGWGGQAKGDPPELLDHRAGRAARDRRAPPDRAVGAGAPTTRTAGPTSRCKLGLKIGASRLLWLAGTYTVLVLVALAFAGTHVGLAQEPL